MCIQYVPLIERAAMLLLRDAVQVSAKTTKVTRRLEFCPRNSQAATPPKGLAPVPHPSLSHLSAARSRVPKRVTPQLRSLRLKHKPAIFSAAANFISTHNTSSPLAHWETMDSAYDHINEAALTPEESRNQQNQGNTLNNDFQEAYKAISSSPWGAKLGGFFGTVVKQV